MKRILGRTLIALIFLVAIGMADLRGRSAWWPKMFPLAVVVTVSWAVLGPCCSMNATQVTVVQSLLVSGIGRRTGISWSTGGQVGNAARRRNCASSPRIRLCWQTFFESWQPGLIANTSSTHSIRRMVCTWVGASWLMISRSECCGQSIRNIHACFAPCRMTISLSLFVPHSEFRRGAGGTMPGFWGTRLRSLDGVSNAPTLAEHPLPCKGTTMPFRQTLFYRCVWNENDSRPLFQLAVTRWCRRRPSGLHR
jgi:hypothetical protein